MRTEQPCIVLNFFRKGFENDVQDQRREEKFKTLSLSVLQESATLCSVRGLLMQLLSVGHHTKITWGICTRRAGKLYKPRSPLYRSHNLQQNMRCKALAEIYTMHSFAPFSNLIFFVKNRQNFFAIE